MVSAGGRDLDDEFPDIRSAVDSGSSLVQLERSRPALDYAGILGAPSGAWTTDDFIAAIYQSLRGRR